MKSRSTKTKKSIWYLIIMVLLVASYCAVEVVLPVKVPALQPVPISTASFSPPSKLIWPTIGQSAITVLGTHILETHSDQTPVPTASTAKLLTALSVLHVKPLVIDEQGPTITLGPNDIANYEMYVHEDGSVLPVSNGEQLTEYQMLEAMMLPSANNIADSIAIWAFGSLSNYQAFANSYAQQLGLQTMHVGSDASGFSPDTTASAQDLVKLGAATMENPVLSQIVGLKSATGFPLTTSIMNVNWLLGSHRIIGVKTGNSNQAGGVYISASNTTVAGKTYTIVTALADAPNLALALSDSIPLIDSSQNNISSMQLVGTHALVGSYKLPWGGTVNAYSETDLNTTVWGGGSAQTKVQLQPLKSSDTSGMQVGTIQVSQNSLLKRSVIPVVLLSAVPKPTWLWLITHPHI